MINPVSELTGSPLKGTSAKLGLLSKVYPKKTIQRQMLRVPDIKSPVSKKQTALLTRAMLEAQDKEKK